jgi:hypothetical protein
MFPDFEMLIICHDILMIMTDIGPVIARWSAHCAGIHRLWAAISTHDGIEISGTEIDMLKCVPARAMGGFPDPAASTMG